MTCKRCKDIDEEIDEGAEFSTTSALIVTLGYFVFFVLVWEALKALIRWII